MNNYRNEVRSQHTRAVAEYRLTTPRAQSDFSQLGYWTIIDHVQAPKKDLGRGETEELAWAVAALTQRFENILSQPDRYRPEPRAD